MIMLYELGRPKSSLGFFLRRYGKPEGTFWPTLYNIKLGGRK